MHFLRDLKTGTPNGGYTVESGGVIGLEFVPANDLGVPGGLAKSNATGVLSRANIPSTTSNEWVNLSGNQKARKGYPSEFFISNYGFKRNYVLKSDYGEISRVGDVITFVPAFSGWVTFSVNGREFNIRCTTDDIQPPSVNKVGFSDIDGGTMEVGTTPFNMYRSEDSHYTSSLQVSAQSNFGSLVWEVEEQRSDLHAFVKGGFHLRQTCYLRASYEGSRYGMSEWGNVRKYAFPEVVANRTSGSSAGSLEPVPVVAVIPSTARLRFTTDAGLDTTHTSNQNFTIPTGANILTVRGKGADGTTTYDPGQPYITPSDPIYKTSTRDVWVEPVVTGWKTKATKTSEIWVMYISGWDKETLVPKDMPAGAVRRIIKNVTPTYNINTERARCVGATLPENPSVGTYPKTYSSISSINSSSDPSSGDYDNTSWFYAKEATYTVSHVLAWGEPNAVTETQTFENEEWTEARKRHYEQLLDNHLSSGTTIPSNPVEGSSYKVCTGSLTHTKYIPTDETPNPIGRVTLALSTTTYTYGKVATTAIPGYWTTEEYQEVVGYNNPGQPYIKPFNVYTTGANATVLVQGQMLTFPGGVGVPAEEEVRMHSLTTVQSSEGTVEATPVSAVVAPGGFIRASTTKGFSISLSESENFDIPRGNYSITISGKGEGGKTINHPGQPYIAPSDPVYATLSREVWVEPTASSYKLDWKVKSTQQVCYYSNDSGNPNNRPVPGHVDGRVLIYLGKLSQNATKRKMEEIEAENRSLPSDGLGGETIRKSTVSNYNYESAGGEGTGLDYSLVWFFANHTTYESSRILEWQAGTTTFTSQVKEYVDDDSIVISEMVTPYNYSTQKPANPVDGSSYTVYTAEITSKVFSRTVDGSSFSDGIDRNYYNYTVTYGTTVHTYVAKPGTMTEGYWKTEFYEELTGYNNQGQSFIEPSTEYIKGADTTVNLQGRVIVFPGGNGVPAQEEIVNHRLVPNDETGGSPDETPVKVTVEQGQVSFLTDKGFSHSATASIVFNIPAGNSIITIEGKGGDGYKYDNPGQPYIADEGPIYETRFREVWVPPVAGVDRSFWEPTETVVSGILLNQYQQYGGGSLYQQRKYMLSYPTLLWPFSAREDDPRKSGKNYYTHMSSIRDNYTGKTYRYISDALNDVLSRRAANFPVFGSEFFELTSGQVKSHHTGYETNSQTGGNSFPIIRWIYATGRRFIAKKESFGGTDGYWKTEEYQHLVGYEKPGQPYIAPFIEDIKGPDLLVEIQGKTHVFPGGVGGPATLTSKIHYLLVGEVKNTGFGSSVSTSGNGSVIVSGTPRTVTSEQSQVASVSFLEMINGHPMLRRRFVSENVPSTVRLVIPAGGSIHLKAGTIDQTYTASTSVVIPTGTESLVATGKGAAGSIVMRPGQEYIPPSDPEYRYDTVDKWFEGTDDDILDTPSVSTNFQTKEEAETDRENWIASANTGETRTAHEPVQSSTGEWYYIGNTRVVTPGTPGYWGTETVKVLVRYINPGQEYVAPYAENLRGDFASVSYGNSLLIFEGGVGGEAPVSIQEINPSNGLFIGGSVYVTKDGKYAYAGVPTETTTQDNAGFVQEYGIDANGIWQKTARLEAPTALRNALLGYQITADATGKRVFITASGEKAVYQFERENGSLVFKHRIVPATMNDGGQFGENIDTTDDGSVLIVGSPSVTTEGAYFIFQTSATSFAQMVDAPTIMSGDTTLDLVIPDTGNITVIQMDVNGNQLSSDTYTANGPITLNAQARKVIARGQGAKDVVNTPSVLVFDGVTYQFPSAPIGMPTERFIDIPIVKTLSGIGQDVTISGDGSRYMVSSPKTTCTHTNQGMVSFFTLANGVAKERFRLTSTEPVEDGNFGTRIETGTTGKKTTIGDPGGQGGVGFLTIVEDLSEFEVDVLNLYYNTTTNLNRFGSEVAISGDGNVQIAANPTMNDNRGHLYVFRN